LVRWFVGRIRLRLSRVRRLAGSWQLYKTKGGDRRPLLSGRGSLTLLAALLLPALSSLLCHCAQSPLSLWDSDREGLSPPLQRRCLLARRPALCRCPSRCTSACAEDLEQKIGGVSRRHPQSSDGARQRFFPPFFFPPLAAFFAMIPPWNWQLSLFNDYRRLQQVG
jgi:hypothetical protein